MITFTIVAILGILLVIVLRQLFQKQKAAAGPVEDLTRLTVVDARAGDSISIAGAGEQYGDLDFTVENRNQYDLGSRRWIELRGTYRSRRVMVEASAGDELEAGVVTDPRKIPLDELGLSEEDLAQMDDRQNTSDNFEYNGAMWDYRLSREFVLLKDSQSAGGNFYGWLFEEHGGKRLLLVRKAEG